MVRAGWKPVIILMVAAVMFFSAVSVQAARKDVVIAEQSWIAAIIECQIWKHVLETRLNIPVTVTSLGQAIAWPAMEKGEVDVIPDMWLPNQKPAIDMYVNEKKVAELSVAYDNASQGVFIPTWVSEKYNIKSIDDLNEHTKIFDLDGDGKGDIWACASAWMCANEMEVKIKSYGLDFAPMHLEQFAFLTLLKERMRKKEPIIFYYWSPEWIFAAYDLTKVEEPPYDQAKWKFTEGDLENSTITCDWLPGISHTAFAASLKDRIPKAYQFFKQWYIPIDQMSLLIKEASDTPDSPKKEPQEVAVQWVKDNPEIVNDWLKGIE